MLVVSETSGNSGTLTLGVDSRINFRFGTVLWSLAIEERYDSRRLCDWLALDEKTLEPSSGPLLALHPGTVISAIGFLVTTSGGHADGGAGDVTIGRVRGISRDADNADGNADGGKMKGDVSDGDEEAGGGEDWDKKFSDACVRDNTRVRVTLARNSYCETNIFNSAGYKKVYGGCNTENW